MTQQIPLDLSEHIRGINPWWRGEPSKPPLKFRRWPFKRLKSLLEGGLTPAVVLRGPRRVGKTELLRQIIGDLLKEGIPARNLLYVPFDELPSFKGIREPVLAVARWYERAILESTFNARAQAGEKVFLFLDEVQNLDAWAPQIKALVDNHAVRVLITGSSSFRIEAGRDSLAGRITTMEMGPLLLREIAELRFGESGAPLWGENGFEALLKADFWREAAGRAPAARRRAFSAFSERGAYPIAHQNPTMPWEEVSSYLNETVVKRAIQMDLRVGLRGQRRDESLLEEVFRLCCRYAGQTPGASVLVPEIQQALSGGVGWSRIRSYLSFLDKTLLMRLVQPLELRHKKKGGSPAKVVLCDHALRASWLQEVVPLDPAKLEADPHLATSAGWLAESALGYFLASVPNLSVAYLPTRGIQPEVDFVVTVGTMRIPVEVKYRRRIDPFDDTRALRAFLEQTINNAPFGLLVTQEDGVEVPDPRIIPISLSAFLWTR